MEKGKDRASKPFFSDPDRAKDLVSLVLRMRGIKAELTGLAMEDPAVSFLDTRISMERLKVEPRERPLLFSNSGGTVSFRKRLPLRGLDAQ